MGIGNDDIRFANSGHDLVFSAGEGTRVAQASQLAYKLGPSAGTEAGHRDSLAIDGRRGSTECHSVKLGQLQMRYVGVDVQPVF